MLYGKQIRILTWIEKMLKMVYMEIASMCELRKYSCGCIGFPLSSGNEHHIVKRCDYDYTQEHPWCSEIRDIGIESAPLDKEEMIALFDEVCALAKKAHAVDQFTYGLSLLGFERKKKYKNLVN